ncbi:MAG: cation diffusion facilitator family transporter [Phycisphaerae bacterium]|nr:cation diffusion facilitator family transporter [Phycisphaerae bacterium]
MQKDGISHYKEIRRVLYVIWVLNWAVAFAKVLVGVISKSAGMTADGFHSFSDGTSNIVGLVGIALAFRPKDTEHPYGHKKFETFFSLGIAFLLGIVCFELLQEGIKRLRKPVLPEITILSFAVMAVTLLVNILVMTYERRKGEMLQSDILVSDSMHTRADILTSISVIISFIAIKLGFPILDAVVTLIIALFIAYAAYGIIKDSSRVLCDNIVITDVKRIEDIVLKINGVKSCHKIRTRGRPDDINLDLHVQMTPDIHLSDAHKISYEIERELRENIPEISDIVVHMEPQ